ncbi:MAG: CoA-binding protein, partial [Bacteroidetes bacterium]|nr:CoA-binding protein [Bacteroidota bacterium]
MKDLKLSRETALQFIAQKEFALAGVSRDSRKFGHVVFKTLKTKGYKVSPINPLAESIGDEPCFKSVRDLPENVKSLVIVLKPSETEKMVKEAIERGIKQIWIQQGSQNENAVKMAREAGITLITDKCI